MAHQAPAPASKFAYFHIIKGVEYGQARGHPLHADVLIPKRLLRNDSSGNYDSNKPTKAAAARPVLVNFHGGGLVGGARDFEPWWSVWLLEWAVRAGAIIVAPDYPLAPESKTPEIVGALHAFMRWLLAPGNLESAMSAVTATTTTMTATSTSGFPHVTPDLTRILVGGESAGGWCALHLGLAFPRDIRALLLRFPMADMDDAGWWEHPSAENSPLAHMLAPEHAEAAYAAHTAAISAGTVPQIVTRGGIERLRLMAAAFFSGRLYDAVGTADDTFPLRKISANDGSVALPPRVWLFHGLDDAVVPVRGAERAARLIEQHATGTEIRLDTRPGNHGFDGEWHLEGEEGVMLERMAWLGEGWANVD